MLLEQQSDSRDLEHIQQARLERTGHVEEPVALPQNERSTEVAPKDNTSSGAVISNRKKPCFRFFGKLEVVSID